MCQVSVTCCCRGGGSNWPALVGLVVAAALVGPAVAALVGLVVSLISAIVTAVCMSVGIVVVGWVLPGVAETVLDHWSDRRHNERMAAIHPHVASQLVMSPTEPRSALPAAQPRRVVAAEVIEVRRSR